MVKEIGKNIWFASISTILPAIFGYIFLLFATKISSIEAIGLVAVISSFTLLITSVVDLGTPDGMKRFLGKAFAAKKMGEFRQVIFTTSIIVSVGITISSILLLFPQLKILEFVGISYDYVWIIIALIISTCFNKIFHESLVASMNSKKTIFPLIVGSISRFPVLLIFVYVLNDEMTGILLAYSSMMFVSTIFYLIYVKKIFKKEELVVVGKISDNFSPIIKAGWATWGPTIISTYGMQLGVIILFATKGPLEAGLFYIPITIFSIVRFIANGVSAVNQPLVAGMEKNEQIPFLKTTLRLAFITTIPIAIPLLLFSKNYLQLIGNDWGASSGMLEILMISLPIVIINGIILTFVYGRGDNKIVLYMGLANSGVSTGAYLLLVPILGGEGAAIGYVAGALANFIVTLIIVNKQKLDVEYKKYCILFFIPLCIGMGLWSISIHYILSSIIIVIGSFILYIKFKLFSDEDLSNIIYSCFSENTANKIHPKLQKLMCLIN